MAALLLISMLLNGYFLFRYYWKECRNDGKKKTVSINKDLNGVKNEEQNNVRMPIEPKVDEIQK